MALGGSGAPPDQSPCFGAATRAGCHDPRLRHVVLPTPAEARRLPNSPCARAARGTDPNVCRFGADPGDAVGTIALVGDSHAGHWRAALETVARARRWHGLSLTHTSCPLSKAVRNLEGTERFRRCAEWKRSVFAWFQRHPEVSTVFVAGLSGGSGVIPPRGQTKFEAAVRGYVRAWAALPATVEHIVVIRDSPKMERETGACVEAAVAAHRRPGLRCAVPRRDALDRDPLVVAARRVDSARVQSVDLTRYFCGRRACYPVVGGALVARDQNHLTAVFSASAGPFLLRKVSKLAAGWRRAAHVAASSASSTSRAASRTRSAASS